MKYSVIVPVYNPGRYFEGCVKSILAQTEPDFELILVDDGSTDGSGAVCDGFARLDSRISAIHKPNGGAGSARNAGIDAASGEYIVFVDADDTVEPGFLACASEALAACPDALVITGMSFDYYRRERLVRTQRLCYPQDGRMSIEEAGERFEKLFSTNSLSSACAKAFSRALITDNALRFDESLVLYEDFEFVLRYMAHTEALYITGKTYYHYFIDAEAKKLSRRMADDEKAFAGMDTVARAALALRDRSFAPSSVSERCVNAVVIRLFLNMASSRLMERMDGIEDVKSYISRYKSCSAAALNAADSGLTESELRFEGRMRAGKALCVLLNILYRRARMAAWRLKRSIIEGGRA